MLQFQQASYLASLIPKYVPTRALRSSSSLSICFSPVKPPWQTLNRSHLLLQTSEMHCQIIFCPFQLFLLLEELSNIIYSCLLTLTVVQNLARSNQLNVSHLMMQRQLLPSHSPETPCRPTKSVPSERLRLDNGPAHGPSYNGPAHGPSYNGPAHGPSYNGPAHGQNNAATFQLILQLHFYNVLQLVVEDESRPNCYHFSCTAFNRHLEHDPCTR